MVKEKKTTTIVHRGIKDSGLTSKYFKDCYLLAHVLFVIDN